jgi:hypothetical protein
MESEQSTFWPVIEQTTPKRGILRELIDTIREHGPVVPQATAAAALQVSRQRVFQLVSEGRLATVTIGGVRHVPMAALELFMTEERKAGRPIKSDGLASRIIRATVKNYT